MKIKVILDRGVNYQNPSTFLKTMDRFCNVCVSSWVGVLSRYLRIKLVNDYSRLQPTRNIQVNQRKETLRQLKDTVRV